MWGRSQIGQSLERHLSPLCFLKHILHSFKSLAFFIRSIIDKLQKDWHLLIVCDCLHKKHFISLIVARAWIRVVVNDCCLWHQKLPFLRTLFPSRVLFSNLILMLLNIIIMHPNAEVFPLMTSMPYIFQITRQSTYVNITTSLF